MSVHPAIAECLAEDRLADAVTAAVAALRARPQDFAARLLLADLLVLSGDFARADAQCEIAARLQPAEAVGLARLRGLIRGMDARRLWFAQAAVPSFPGGPTARDEAALRLDLALRAGDGGGARKALDELNALSGTPPARVDNENAEDLRDLDDRLFHAVEAVTDGGAYLWIDMRRIRSLQLSPATRPRDWAWRKATLALRDGSTADVLLPLIYGGDDTSEAERLGRSTRWVEEPGGIVAGRGQRCLLVGEDVRTLGEIGEIAFEADDHA